MTFFVTSTGTGKGGDLGGLSGADAHCQALAQSVGAGSRTWRAYLSTSAAGGAAAVNARDRIGRGPWQNAKGEAIAKDVADLHGASNNLTKQTALTEKGEVVNGRGDTPNMHDVLTGSQPDGTAFAGTDDKTCGNWTKSGEGSAVVGHHDRMGLNDSAAGQVVELLARLAWVQRGRAEDHRRRGPAVLLRRELAVRCQQLVPKLSMFGLVPTILPSDSSGAFGTLDLRDNHKDDTENLQLAARPLMS